MTVKITDRYFVEVDDKNFTLKEDLGKVDKNGKLKVKDVGYYSTMESALNNVIKLSALSDETITLKEYVTRLQELKYKIDELIK